MADCYFLGIGGTGSKCVDTYVYSCAAGLGPEKLWIGMVDQDSGCGNVDTKLSHLICWPRDSGIATWIKWPVHANELKPNKPDKS